MREQLCMALALRKGQTITPEMAVALVRELFPDRSYAPELFGQTVYADYVFQCERFTEVLPELHGLNELHYAETEDYLAGIPMDPDYKGMQESEHAGRLIQFTARVKATGQLVGNMRVYIYRSMHNQKLFCEEDTFFVLKAHRGGFMAVRLWQFVENAVRYAVGVRGVEFDSKLSNKADKMALYLKYKPVSTRFIKTF